MAVRIRLRRTKGWRKPAGAVAVCRPGAFGNPFTVAGAREAGYGTHNRDGSRATPEESDRMLAVWCVELFREWLGPNRDRHDPDRRARLLAALPALRDKDLCCWCPIGSPCHADVLLELAAAPPGADAPAEPAAGEVAGG